MAIHTIHSLAEINPWLSTLQAPHLLLDIDETLITTPEHLGSEKWYEERVFEKVALGKDLVVATLEANAEWEKVQESLEAIPVDTRSIDWIRNWSELGIPIWGITARRPAFAERTRQQLEKAGIPLTHPTVELEVAAEAKFEQGILYVGPLGNKGEALAVLFSRLGPPQSALMVDDKPLHLENARLHLTKLGVSFRGARILVRDR